MQILKRLSVLLLVSILICLVKTEVYAQPNPAFYGNAGSEVSGTYTITMKKMEISTDGTNWVTLGESEQSFNIASGNAGATIGSYISNTSIPAGTYNYLRITQSRTITIKGRTTTAQAGSFYYTSTSAGQTSGFYNAGSVAGAAWPATDPADYTAVPFQVPEDAQAQAGETITISGVDMIFTKNQSSNPIIITAGQTRSMSISFNTASMIGFEVAGANYIFYPLAPQETYSEE